MAESRYERFYPRSNFTVLVGPVPFELVRAGMVALVLTAPIADINLTATHGVIVKWQDIPSTADIAAVDGFVAGFVGGSTTSEPFEIESMAATAEAAGSLVDKIDFTTPALVAGVYQVLWLSMIRMQSAVANTGVLGRITLSRSDGVTRQWESSWDMTQRQTFGGGLTFRVTTGQTIRARLQVQKLGAAAATAEMSAARVTIDQISAA